MTQTEETQLLKELKEIENKVSKQELDFIEALELKDRELEIRKKLKMVSYNFDKLDCDNCSA